MHVLPVKAAVLLPTPAPSTLLCPPNHKHLLLSSDSDPKSQRKLYYDHCLPASTPINELYSNLNVDEYIQNVVQGYNSAIFTIGAGETKKFGVLSSQLYIQALLNLKDSLQKLNNVRLKYAFLGLSDARCVNLLQERGLQADALIKAIESIYEPVTSVDDIIAKFKQGSSLPFVLLIRVEKTGTSPLIGNLLLSDIGIVKFDTTDNLSHGPSLNKSFQVLRRIVSMLAQTSFMGPLPYSESVLTSVSADYFGGNGKTLCVFNTESSTPTPSPETLAALSFAESMRRVKNRFTKNSVDHRIYNLEKQLSELTIQHNEFAQLAEKTEAEAQLREQMMNQQIELLKKEYEKLEDKLDDKQNEVNKNEQEIERLNNTVGDWRKKFQNLELQYNKFKDEVKSNEMVAAHESLVASSKLAEYQEELRNLNIRLSVISDERDRFKLEKESLASSKEMLTERCHSLEKAQTLHMQSFKEAQKSFQMLETEYHTLEEELDKANSSNATLAAKLDSLRSQLEVQRAENKKLTNQLTSLEHSHESSTTANSALSTSLNNAKSKIEQLQSDVTEHQSTIIELKSSNVALKAELASMESSNSSLSSTLDSTNSKLSSTESQISMLEENLKELKLEKSKVEGEKDRLTNLIDKLSGSLEKVSDEFKSVKEELENEKSEVEKELGEIKNKWKESRITLKSLENEKESLEDELSQLKKKLKHAEKQHSSTSEEERDAHHKELQDLKTQFRAIDSEKTVKFEKERQELETHISELKKQMKEMDKSARNELKKEKEVLVTEIKELKKKIKESSKARESSWLDERETMQSEIEKLKKQMSDIGSAEKKLIKENVGLKKQVSELQTQQSSEITSNKPEKTTKAQTAELQKLQKKIAEMENAMAKSEEAKMEWEKDKDCLLSYIESLKKKAASVGPAKEEHGGKKKGAKKEVEVNESEDKKRGRGAKKPVVVDSDEDEDVEDDEEYMEVQKPAKTKAPAKPRVKKAKAASLSPKLVQEKVKKSEAAEETADTQPIKKEPTRQRKVRQPAAPKQSHDEEESKPRIDIEPIREQENNQPPSAAATKKRKQPVKDIEAPLESKSTQNHPLSQQQLIPTTLDPIMDLLDPSDNGSTLSMSTDLSTGSTSSGSVLGALKKKRKLNFGKPRRLLNVIDDFGGEAENGEGETDMNGDDTVPSSALKLNKALEQIKQGFTIPNLNAKK